ncbi:MAG: GtrA family protein [Marinibacterium sp.]
MTRSLPEVARFFVVAAAGLVIDVGTATAMITALGMADIPAAAIGLFAGMVFNYFLHLTWTFKGQSGPASLAHFLRFAIGVAATLVIRAAVLWSIEALGWQPLLPAFVRLTIGAAVSFVLSYVINRYLIFTPAAGPAK